jgi:phospholipase/lecithinase/hemolysin
MKRSGIMRWLVCGALLLACAPLVAQAHGAQRLVIFGDSLSDPGNYYAAFHESSAAPYAWVPDAPYAIGAMHFSNGATWVEQLARALHASADAGPALASPGTARNYAVGRARARAGAPAFPYYDLSAQVSLFATDTQGQAPADAVYVIWIGGNDERDALERLAVGDYAGAGAIVQAAVMTTAGNIQALWSMGAREFLVLPGPDISFVPAVAALGPAAQGAAAQLAAAYNAGLGQALAALRALPGVEIRELDSNAVIVAAMAMGGKGEPEDFTTPCLRFGVVVRAVCREPEDYFFWDGIHPTTAGHALVARAALQRLRAAN